MIVLSLVVVGAASYFRLGIDRFPRVDLPQVAVRTTLPSASVEETEVQITQPIEEAMNTVEGITELRSVTGAGTSNVFAVFDLDRDIDVAAQDVRDRVGPVVRLAARGDARPLRVQVQCRFGRGHVHRGGGKSLGARADRGRRQDRQAAHRTFQRRRRGVDLRRPRAGHQHLGGRRSPGRAQAADQRGRRARSRVRIRTRPAATSPPAPTERILRTTGRITDPEDFNDLVIRTVNGVPLRIRDIGRAEDGTKEQRSLARLNGVPTVVLEVRGQIGANTIEVIDSVKANLALAEAELPPGVRLEIIRDQSRYIEAALHEIDKHLVLGSILACLVVFAFMRNWRSTVIAAVAIPASVIATFGMMAALDFTLNSVTMLALVLMVGIVIDDAIVVLENIFRFVEEKKLSPFDAARQATAEIALPVLATTLCLVVIFIPVSFMSSISGKFLYQFGFTAAVAILVSLLVSFTLTPMMSARLFRRQQTTGGHGGSRQGFYRHIDRFYTGALTWALGRSTVVAMVAVLVIASAYPLYRVVRQEFIPTDVDEAEFQLQVTAPEGTSTAAMDDILRAIDRGCSAHSRRRDRAVDDRRRQSRASSTPGRPTCASRPHEERIFSLQRLVVGLVTPRSAGGVPRQLQPARRHERRSGQTLRKYPDLRTGVRNIQSFNIGGGNTEFEFVIRGPELAKLSEYGEALRARAPELGLLDADVTLKIDKPELRVVIDRARAADLGVSTADIGAALRVMVGGDQEVSSYRDPAVNEEYDVQLRLDERFRDDPAVIQRLYVSRDNGESGATRQPRLDRDWRGPVTRGSHGSPASGVAARRHRSRLRARRSHRGGARGGGRAQDAARLLGLRRRPWARARADVRRVRVGVPALDRLHVHGAGGAVREPRAPAGHSAVAAVVAPLRARSRCGRPATR